MEIEQWLEDFVKDVEDGDVLDQQIVIVGIIGKETEDQSNVDLINKFLKRSVFHRRLDNCSLVSIDVFYSDEHHAVFLFLHGLDEASIQHYLFRSEHQNDKSFFEKLASIELHYTHLLHIIFVLSHIVLFIDQSCHFDLGWLRTLSLVNELRAKGNQSLQEFISTITNEPDISLKECTKNGRMSIPRMIFAFRGNPIRQDLIPEKKKEVLENMEKCLEGQISSLLRQKKLIESNDASLGTLTLSIGQPFVYIFSHKETPIDITQELANILYNPDPSQEMTSDQIIEWVEKRIEKEKQKQEQKRCDYNFGFFLTTSLNNLREPKPQSSDKKEKANKERAVLKLPKLNDFILFAAAVWRWFTEGDQDKDPEKLKDIIEVNKKINEESTTIKWIAEDAVEEAKKFYKHLLELQKKKNASNAEAVFSTEEHRKAMAQVLEYLYSVCRIAGKQRIMEAQKNIETECLTIWNNGHVRCEIMSLTNHMCSFAKHKTENEKAELSAEQKTGRRLRFISHYSNHKTYSVCNCGQSQLVREDPFSLKEANFSFYKQAAESYGCCDSLEKFEFPVFKPVTIERGEDQLNKNPLYEENFYPAIIRRHDANYPLQQDDDDLALPNPQEYNIRFFDEDDQDIPDDPTNEQAKSEANKVYAEENIEQLSANEYADADELDQFLEQRSQTGEQPDIMDPLSLENEDLSEFDEDEHSEHSEDDQSESRAIGKRLKNILGITESSSDMDDDADDVRVDSETAHSKPRSEKLRTSESEGNQSSVGSPTKRDQHSQNSETEFMKFKEVEMDEFTIREKFKGYFLDHMPHSHSPKGFLPLFPSFSLLCVGSSGLYQHATGLMDKIRSFRNGSEYLLPYDFELKIDPTKWLEDLQQMTPNLPDKTYNHFMRQQRRLLEGSTDSVYERVKLFIGLEYECPRGHRFLLQEHGKPLRHQRSSGVLKTSASPLVENDQAIWMPCPCKHQMVAQLMRIHVVTPKAPVTVHLTVRIQADKTDEEICGYFHPGMATEGPVFLSLARYYVMRLPYIYKGPSGQFTCSPKWPEFQGKLLRNFIDVHQISFSHS